jgi:hypothetical protein
MTLPSPDKFKTIRYLHNNAKSAHFGGRFQQDIEPAGFYMIADELGSGNVPDGWVRGTKTFRNPLVIEWNTNPSGGYDATSWKAVLSLQYKAKGRALSRKLLDAGYDVIVTIRGNDTSEMVDLTPIGMPRPQSAMQKKFVVYHGTGAQFKRFNPKVGNQPIVWFASDKQRITRGEVGAKGSGFVITAEVTINNPAGWKEYHNLTIGELKGRGYDGVILPESDGRSFNCFVWNTKQIRILKNEVVSA